VPIRVLHVLTNSFSLIWLPLIIYGEEYKLRRSLQWNYLHPRNTSFLLDPNILDTLFSNTLNLCSSLNVRDQVPHPYRTTCKVSILHFNLLVNSSQCILFVIVVPKYLNFVTFWKDFCFIYLSLLPFTCNSSGGRLRFIPVRGIRILLCVITSWPALRPNHPILKWKSLPPSPRAKRQEREALSPFPYTHSWHGD
jgi:hypothetical protein